MYSSLNKLISHSSLTQLTHELGLLHDVFPSLTLDSRKVKPGMIFCAYPGVQSDGRNFIDAAIQAGAAGIIWEPGIEFKYALPNWPLAHTQQYVGLLAAEHYAKPSRYLPVIAVTGTNGKTSISHWLNQAFNSLGQVSALIGTTGAGIYPTIHDYAATTPDPITLQQLIAGFVQNGANLLAMEVSSHALDQGRVNGIEFTSAIFSNLTQDHLDYHGTMEDYFQAKRQLFYWHGLEHAIINHDDEYGARLIAELAQAKPNLHILSYGIEHGDIQARNVKLSRDGIRFELWQQNEWVAIAAPVIGRFNLYNLLAVFATLICHGVSLHQLPALALQLTTVVGRMQMQKQAAKPLVVIDYAHTPDALHKALLTLADIKGHGRLFCVFGCGGDRDRGKRPLMGATATTHADWVIITSDNPRFEEPETIIQEICQGIHESNYQIISERAQAISAALALATPADIVLIAGKGHENYQEIAGVKHPFSDLELVRELLNG